MKKNKRMSDILKRILCAVMVLCMVVPNVMAYAGADGEIQIMDDGAEVSFSINDLGFLDEEKNYNTLKDDSSGIYSISKDRMNQKNQYIFKVNMAMGKIGDTWNAIDGDTYSVALGVDGSDAVDFGTLDNAEIYFENGEEKIDIGSYSIASNALVITFDDSVVLQTDASEINAVLELPFVIDTSKLDSANDTEVNLNIGDSHASLKLPAVDGTDGTGEDNKVPVPDNETNDSKSEVVFSDNNNTITGNISGQKTWKDEPIKNTEKPSEVIDWEHAGTFTAKLSNNRWDANSEESKHNVNFSVTSSLNSEYLQAIYTMAGNEAQESENWWQGKNIEGLLPLTFSLNLGDIWKLPGEYNGNKIEDKTKIDLNNEEGKKVAVAEFSVVDDSLQLDIMYDTNTIYIHHNNVGLELEFSLCVDESKTTEAESFKVEWNSNKEVNLIKNPESEVVESEETGLDFSKTVAGITNDDGVNTTVTDGIFAYELKARKWKRVVNSENPSGLLSYLSLEGSTLKDVISEGLSLERVKANGQELSKNEYSWNASSREFSYVYPNSEGVNLEDEYVIELSVRLDEAAIKEVKDSGQIVFENKAILMSDGVSEPKEAVQITTVRKIGLDKEGTVDLADGNRINWIINAESYFSSTADSYIVDRIEGTIQDYDLNTLKLDGKPLDITDLSEDYPIDYNLYESLQKKKDNDVGAVQIRALLESKRSDDGYGSGAYLFKATYDEKEDYILIIPYSQYHNGNHQITYDTVLHENLQGVTSVTNDVTLIWDHQGGPGPGSFEWDVNISKGPNIVGDYLEKEGVTYDEATQEATWRIRIDPYGKGIDGDVTVTDIFNNSVQTLIRDEKTYPILNIYKENNKGTFDLDDKIVLNENKTNPPQKNGEYSLQSCDEAGNVSQNGSYSILTVPLTDITKDKRYIIEFKTKVIDTSILSVQKEQDLENKATLKFDKGGEDVSASGINKVTNTLIEKRAVENTEQGFVYNYKDNTITWEVAINRNAFPISNAVLTEILPFGSELVEWKVKVDGGEFKKPSKTEGDLEKADISEGLSISREFVETVQGNGTTDGIFTKDTVGIFKQRTEKFIFTPKSTIANKYIFQFTTQFSDAEFLQAFLMTSNKVSFINTAQLNGKIGESEISDASATAVYTIDPQPVIKTGKGVNQPDKSEDPDYITWAVDINRSGADIQGATITEDFSESGILELDTASLKFYEMTVLPDGSLEQSGDQITDVSSNIGSIEFNEGLRGFKLAIKENEVFNKCFRIVFNTYITDDVIDAGALTNKVTVDQKGEYSYTTENIKSDYKVQQTFSAWANASPSPLIRVMKYAATHNDDNSNFLPLENATMKLDAYKENGENGYQLDSEKSKTKITASSGYANFILLKEMIVYDLYEQTAPAGYIRSQEHKYFMFVGDDKEYTNGATVQMKIGNSNRGVKIIKKVNGEYQQDNQMTDYGNSSSENMSITLKKIDNDGNTLDGVTFTLQDVGSALMPLTAVTKDGGVATFSNINVGKYKLTETMPEGRGEYCEKIEPILIMIKAKKDNTAEITKIVNPEANNKKLTINDENKSKGSLEIQNFYKRGNIKLKKVDAISGIGLPRASFGLYIKSKELPLETSVSNNEGLVEFKDIPYNPNGYIIKELTAPSGYTVDNKELEITSEMMKQKGNTFTIDLTTNSDSYWKNTRLMASIEFEKWVKLEETGTVSSASAPKYNRTFTLTYLGSGIENAVDDSNEYFENCGSDKHGFLKSTDGLWIRTVTSAESLTTPKYLFANIPLGKYRLTEASSNEEGDAYTTFTKEINLMAEYTKIIGDKSNFVYKVNSEGAPEGEIINEYLKADVFISKIDSVTEEVLSGVAFTLEGETIDKIAVKRENLTTQDDGQLVIASLPVGTYTLTETKAPDNYTIGSSYTIKVVSEYDADLEKNVAKAYIKRADSSETDNGAYCSEGSTPYVIPNDAVKGTLGFTKLGNAISEDILKDAELVNVAFKLKPVVQNGSGRWSVVKDADGNEKAISGATNDKGIFQMENLPYGNYLLTETAPDGYYSVPPVLILKSENEDTTCYQFEKGEKGITEFSWTGSYYNATAEFDQEGNTIYKAGDERKTYKSGDEIIIRDIPVVTDATFTKIKIVADTIEVGEVLEGAVFTVERLGSGGGIDDSLKFGDANIAANGYKKYALCDEVTSDENGIVHLEKLVCGTYRITEIKWPSDARPIDAKSQVVMYLVITKADDGKYYITRFNDNNGEIGTKVGNSVEIAETSDATPNMDVVANSPYELGSVEFIKISNGGNAGKLADAEFGLFRKDESGNYVAVKRYENGDDVITETGEEGKGFFGYLSYGQYAIKELKAPEGHILDNTYYEFEISENNLIGAITNQGITDNTITNKQNSYQIQKQDMSGKLLNGAVFTVTGRFANGAVSTTKTYTVNGTSALIAGELVAGESYVIKETAAPAGYTIAAPVTVKIDENGQLKDSAGNAIADNKVIIKDEMIDMGLYKVSAADFNAAGTAAMTRLEGAEFTVTPATGSSFADGSKSLVINDQNYGTAFRGKLTAGSTYTVTETKAPYGYTVAAPFTFTVDAGGGASVAAAKDYVKVSTSGQLVIYVADEQGTGNVTFVKKDAESGAELTGAGFKLYRKSISGSYEPVADKTLYTGNTYRMTGTSVIDNGTANTPANGKLTVSGLLWGSYQFIEVTAPNGYVLDTTPYMFEITGTKANGMSVDLGTVKNQKKAVEVEPTPGGTTGSVVVTKTVFYEGKPLAVHDLSFYAALYSDADLTNRASEIMELAFTGSYSTTATFDNLPLGTYYVAEVDEFGDVYDGSDIGMEVEVIDQQCVLTQANPRGSAVIKNTMPELPDGFYIDPTGKLTVTKKVLNKDKTEAAVKNTSFYVTLFSDEDYLLAVSDPMEIEITNGSSGTVIFDELALGNYYLAETDEDGFPVDVESDDFAYTPVFSKDSFEIADEKQSVEVTLTNTLKEGEVAPTATPKATVTTKPGTYSSSPARSTLSIASTSSKATNAKTGDETPLFWYFVLLAAASAGIILTVSRKRKKMK